ncbi:MAG: hypothetical protein ACT4PU_10665 [Planctomycetota bacterium]
MRHRHPVRRRHSHLNLAASLACSLGLLAVAGCSGPKGTYVTPAELAAMESGSMGASAAQGGANTAGPSPSEALQKRRDDLDLRQLQLDRRRQDHAAALTELARKQARTTLEQTAAVNSEEHEARRANWDLGNAKRDLDYFLTVERERRLKQDALEVRASLDGLLEAREELAQLEMMYSGADLGDATAEIVLNRGRRRLERAEESHRLREIRSAELQKIVLPREAERLELEFNSKTLTKESVRVAAEKARSQRESALAELSAGALKLERDLEDIEREARLQLQDRQRWERDYATELGQPAGQAP